MLGKKIFFMLLMVAISGNVIGQDANSLFSKLGVGQPINPAHSHQFGMGGVGLSNSDLRYINLQNPALLTYNSIYTFSAGMRGENRTIKTKNASENDVKMNLAYLAFAFPIKPGKWTSALSISPYSLKNYEFTYTTDIVGHPGQSTVNEKGKGSINQLTWSNGFNVFKNFNLGIKASVMFSAITSEYKNAVVDPDIIAVYAPSVISKEAYSGVVFGGGFSYRIPLKDKLDLNIGGIYDFKKDLKTTVTRTFELQDAGSGSTIDVDSLAVYDSRTGIPSNYGFGVSIGKPFNWTAGIDFKVSNWSEYYNIDGESENINNSWSLALGGEFTPDNGSTDNYLSRVTYRLGARYEKTPYNVENSVVNDFGINFGVSLPAGISSIDISGQIGKRGNLNAHLFHENYFKFILGITFNDRRWFVKRKFD